MTNDVTDVRVRAVEVTSNVEESFESKVEWTRKESFASKGDLDLWVDKRESLLSIRSEDNTQIQP